MALYAVGAERLHPALPFRYCMCIMYMSYLSNELLLLRGFSPPVLQ